MLLGALRSLVLSAMPAAAQRIENSVAVFAALDKVTAKISRLEVPLNQTATFGALKVTPRACYTRAPTEPPKTTTFVEVDEIAARRQGEAHLLGLDVRRQPRPQCGGASRVRRVADGLRAAARHGPASAAGRSGTRLGCTTAGGRRSQRLRAHPAPPRAAVASSSTARAGSGDARACLGNRRAPDVVAVDPVGIDPAALPQVFWREVSCRREVRSWRVAS